MMLIPRPVSPSASRLYRRDLIERDVNAQFALEECEASEGDRPHICGRTTAPVVATVRESREMQASA